MKFYDSRRRHLQCKWTIVELPEVFRGGRFAMSRRRCFKLHFSFVLQLTRPCNPRCSTWKYIYIYGDEIANAKRTYLGVLWTPPLRLPEESNTTPLNKGRHPRFKMKSSVSCNTCSCDRRDADGRILTRAAAALPPSLLHAAYPRF